MQINDHGIQWRWRTNIAAAQCWLKLIRAETNRGQVGGPNDEYMGPQINLACDNSRSGSFEVRMAARAGAGNRVACRLMAATRSCGTLVLTATVHALATAIFATTPIAACRCSCTATNSPTNRHLAKLCAMSVRANARGMRNSSQDKNRQQDRREDP